MVSSREKGVEMQDYMINWNVGPLGLVLRPDLGTDMPPVVSQVLPGESVASLAGVSVGDMLVSVNGKKASKLGYEKAMKLLYKQKLPIILHFRIPQFKTVAADPYYQQHTPTSMSGTPSNTHAHTPHTPGAYAGHSPYGPPPPPPPYPGQYVQYNHHQQQQYQSPQPRQANGTRGARSHSVLSTSTATREQKLRKQFSVVWESGSLGFSFRPYAPGVNIPTVDLIGARGEGKNMDQVCVNDVLIAINGENTKSLGVERVLKMLHVLEKPVVLRFHKSSQRIENPTAAPRMRRKSSIKLPAVVEREQEDEEKQQQQQQQRDGEDGDEDGMPAVRFADQIRLRSESKREDPSSPPPPPPPPLPQSPTPPSTPEPTPRRFSSRGTHEEMNGVSRRETAAVSHHAVRKVSNAASPSGSNLQRAHHHGAQPHGLAGSRMVHDPTFPPAPPGESPVRVDDPMLHPEDDDLDFPEPDEETEDVEIDESQLPHVPITIVGSVPPKRPSSSFVIPLEHAQQIVAKSSGKPVELCQFGGIPLLDIQEGSVQAKLLVTFAKACLAKQMKQMKEQDNGVASKPDRTQSPPPHEQPPRTPSPNSSENRSMMATAGSSYVASNASTFNGNSLGPGKPKFLAFSFHQTKGTEVHDHPHSQSRVYSQASVSPRSFLQTQRNLHQEVTLDQRSVILQDSTPTKVSSGGFTNSTDRSRSSDDTPRKQNEKVAESHVPLVHDTEVSPAVATPSNLSEADRTSAGGLTMSQLRVSDKLTAADIDPELHGMLKDLGKSGLEEGKEDLPTRVTEMISLNTSVLEEETKVELKEDSEVVVSQPGQGLTQSPLEPTPVHIESAPVNAAPAAKEEAQVEAGDASSNQQEIAADELVLEGKTRHRKSSATAHPNHPIIQSLCVGSRDLELVMAGREIDMILCKKHVVEEIQDILDSLEMELQFERHSHVGFGRGSIEDEPPVRCCSRCGKNGDIADLALDSERRELYCQNCWDVFFYRPTAGSPRSSQGRRVAPEFDTPTDFDPFEYSLHDSIVNVADDFHPWRHLNFEDSSSERDSNATLSSTITSHADEVWL